MIEKIGIKNYKSIVDDEIELGRINVFIGENGAGKSNILEAVAMLGTAKSLDYSFSVEELYTKGVRVTNPGLMFNSFIGKKAYKSINIKVFSLEKIYETALIPENVNDRYSKWIDQKKKESKDEILKNEFSNILQKEPLTIKSNEHGPFQIKEKTKDDEYNNKPPKYIGDEELNQIKEHFEKISPLIKLHKYVIYTLNTLALRGINSISRLEPLGINGEGLDILISTFNKEEMNLLKEYSYFISWLKDVIIDEKDLLKFNGNKLNRSTSKLYFKDQYMKRTNNIFAAENANEGALYVLFYLALFISKKTPGFFAIDNIETALNPKLCRELMKSIAALSKKTDKQALITTHNPAILDSINLNDDEQRLFEVYRTDEGYTKTRRIRLKPKTGKLKYKLSELWMNGDLGGVPNNFL